MGWQHNLVVVVARRIHFARVSDSPYPGNHMGSGQGFVAQTAESDVVAVVQEATVVLHRSGDSWGSWRSSVLLQHVLPDPDEDVRPRHPLPLSHPGPPHAEWKLIPRSA